MRYKAEYRVKEERLPWADTKIMGRVAADDRHQEGAINKIDAQIEDLSNIYGAEIRWNFEESLQGHYISGLQ